MLRKLAVVLAGAVALTLSACAGAPQLTFAQQVSIACGAANGEIAILKGDGVFTGGAQKTLTDTVQPAVDKVCSAGASVTKPDLQSIVNATLPLVKSLVDSSSLSPDKINAADAAIDTGVLAFNIAISLAPAVTATASVAASTPLAGAPLQ
ncbi:hypothetical protein [Paraburkholderia dilworthii]|uniref:hypothetical protein n=1 Tax=Paraburkholderia dilworthii TaxID=948106 RepID=UPI00041FAA06|nr:hypothetical protein [Paraburkholderia dilworthii]